MKTVIILGSGNSGAGAIRLYYLKRFRSISGKIQIITPRWIKLYIFLNFCVNSFANTIYNFKEFIRNSYSSNYNKKNKVFSENIIKFSDIFLDQISQTKYNGSPQFFLDKLSKFKKLSFYFNRFFLKKNEKKIPLINMTLPCSEELFFKYAEEFILNIIKSNKNLDEKNIVIEQGGSF